MVKREPSQAELSRVESQAKSSQVKSSQVKLSRVESSQVKSSQVKRLHFFLEVLLVSSEPVVQVFVGGYVVAGARTSLLI